MRKRKKRGDERAAAGAPSPSSASFDLHFFPVLLAAARTTRQSSSSCSPAALAARLLRRVLSHSPQTLSPLPASLVALLPLLLSSRCVGLRTSQTPLPPALNLQESPALRLAYMPF
jgi:bifunctional lysine-specific demethylase and histidyl-hydroxylase MINA